MGLKSLVTIIVYIRLQGNVFPLCRSLPLTDEEDREKVCQSLEQEEGCLLPSEQAEEVHRLVASQAPSGQALLCIPG